MSGSFQDDQEERGKGRGERAFALRFPGDIP